MLNDSTAPRSEHGEDRQLGRLASRTVGGQGAETFQYDAIGRLITHTNDLGSFTLSYLGQTGQLTSRTLAGSTLATTWSYLPNSGDRRLSGIDNTGLTAGQYSNYAFTTTPENLISGITETSDASSVYPAAGTQTATYNNLNQLTDLSGQALTFDAVGNLTSDGQRTYSWDASTKRWLSPGGRRLSQTVRFPLRPLGVGQ
ncbi:hypothetical protein [Enhydrobacter sp.]|uniref:hypothetical protein n=1 Tax=Enhydrobacter sp. TaxID=1894999 RepID=UPI0026289071|nr:hypothetical protein [Enhydrobacter sp.]